MEIIEAERFNGERRRQESSVPYLQIMSLVDGLGSVFIIGNCWIIKKSAECCSQMEIIEAERFNGERSWQESSVLYLQIMSVGYVFGSVFIFGNCWTIEKSAEYCLQIETTEAERIQV
ncbi:hypothetical protein AVEN_135469-1 [Araneus ventricosus]|uniref:Uncharacterized protein n=1 Tax=Araneus ventricosus TaxID=182803 RepID=A0A4Y2BED5_ARAVE|nr:hypothetical protein AVEN_135469-1 [Araneus ventricosus]